jgi:hypothetical protein
MNPIHKGLHDHVAETLLLVLRTHGDVNDLEEAPAVADDASDADWMPRIVDNDAEDDLPPSGVPIKGRKSGVARLIDLAVG